MTNAGGLVSCELFTLKCIDLFSVTCLGETFQGYVIVTLDLANLQINCQREGG